MSEEEKLFRGFWEIIKHSNNVQLQQKQLEQKEREIHHFAASQNQQTQLFSKQLEIIQKQVTVQEHQTKILDETKKVYVVIAVGTFLMVIANFMLVVKG